MKTGEINNISGRSHETCLVLSPENGADK